MKRQDITIYDCATSPEAERIINGKPFDKSNELVLLTRKELWELYYTDPHSAESDLARTCAQVAENIDATCTREEHIESLRHAIELDSLFQFALRYFIDLETAL